MKRNYKFFMAVLLASACFNLVSCGDDDEDETSPSTEEVTLQEINFTEDSYEAVVGEEFTLTLETEPQEVKVSKVSYTSSDENVATVDEKGNVTCLAAGKTTIKASVAGVSAAKCVVIVSEKSSSDEESGDENKSEESGEEENTEGSSTEEGGDGESTEESSSDVDLNGYNIFDHTFYITSFYCDEITLDEQALKTWSYYMNVQSIKTCAENKYSYSLCGHRHEIDLVYSHVASVSLDLDKYDTETQCLEVSTDDDTYTGTVQLSQDDKYIYMEYSGESYRGGKPLTIKAHQEK